MLPSAIEWVIFGPSKILMSGTNCLRWNNFYGAKADSDDTEEVIPETPPSATTKIPTLPLIEDTTVGPQSRPARPYFQSSAIQQQLLRLCLEGLQSGNPSTSDIIHVANKMKGLKEAPLTINDRNTGNQNQYSSILKAPETALLQPLLQEGTLSTNTLNAAIIPSPFLFEAYWLQHQDCSSIIATSWASAMEVGRDLPHKLRIVSSALNK